MLVGVSNLPTGRESNEASTVTAVKDRTAIAERISATSISCCRDEQGTDFVAAAVTDMSTAGWLCSGDQSVYDTIRYEMLV